MILKNLVATLLVISSATLSAQTITGHTSDVMRSKIYVKGITQPLRVMHLTDNHMTSDGPDDEPYKEYTARMLKSHAMMRHYKTREQITPKDAYKEILSKAKGEGVELIALTGDNINYPSPTAVRYMIEELEAVGLPYIYIAGNHDWHYEGMEGSTQELRSEWTERHLKPLYQGANPMYSAQQIGGLNIVAIDNSTSQMMSDQVEFYRQQKALGMPILLLIHIPMYTPGNNDGIGDPQWGADKDLYWREERRAQWPKEGNNQATVEFWQEVISTPGVIVLCGHTHTFSVDQWGGMLQFCANESADGSYRIIDIIPDNE